MPIGLPELMRGTSVQLLAALGRNQGEDQLRACGLAREHFEQFVSAAATIDRLDQQYGRTFHG